MGAAIDSDDGHAPLRIRGGRHLHGIEYASPVASAQVKSAVLLAGLYAQGETVVREPQPTRDYTEAMRSEEHTSELQSLMRISYAVFCLKKNTSKHPQQIPDRY